MEHLNAHIARNSLPELSSISVIKHVKFPRSILKWMTSNAIWIHLEKDTDWTLVENRNKEAGKKYLKKRAPHNLKRRRTRENGRAGKSKL